MIFVYDPNRIVVIGRSVTAYIIMLAFEFRESDLSPCFEPVIEIVKSILQIANAVL